MAAAVILLLVIGGAAGVLATRLMRVEASLPAAMLVGIAGTMVGALLLRGIVTIGGWAISFSLAVLGAIILIWIWQHLRR